MCGEKTGTLFLLLHLKGSPPRVRGKVCWSLSRGSCTRITPACAGKGATALHLGITLLGSPPRVRGKGGAPDGFFHTLRITPACAGKSWLPLPPSAGGGDHPRVCGEKGSLSVRQHRGRGSPPRVRGKDCHGVRGVVVFGITPACAGKSLFECLEAGGAEDHPRVCGEKTKKSP